MKPAKLKNTILLNNRTHYQSRDLKKLFARVFKEYKRERPTYRYGYVNVKVIYRRLKDKFCGGYAWYDSNSMCIKMPKIKTERGYDSKDTFAQGVARTFHHEMDHCFGLRHGQMIRDGMRNVSYIDFDIKEKAVPKKKVKTDEIKVISLLERKKRWETKMKKGRTAISKINRTLKYYERKQAALNNKHENTDHGDQRLDHE